jgi:hypothetical protein
MALIGSGTGQEGAIQVCVGGLRPQVGRSLKILAAERAILTVPLSKHPTEPPNLARSCQSLGSVDERQDGEGEGAISWLPGSALMLASYF